MTGPSDGAGRAGLVRLRTPGPRRWTIARVRFVERFAVRSQLGAAVEVSGYLGPPSEHLGWSIGGQSAVEAGRGIRTSEVALLDHVAVGVDCPGSTRQG